MARRSGVLEASRCITRASTQPSIVHCSIGTGLRGGACRGGPRLRRPHRLARAAHLRPWGRCDVNAGRRQRFAIMIRSRKRPISDRISWNGSARCLPHRHGGQIAMSSQHRPLADPRPDEYRILPEADLRDYLAGLPGGRSPAGERRSPGRSSRSATATSTSCSSSRGAGGVAVKQALPPTCASSARLAAAAVALALRISGAHASGAAGARPGASCAAPQRGAALVVMELLEPHIIMRKGLIAGTPYPSFVGDIATFLARTLFFLPTSRFPLPRRRTGLRRSPATMRCARSRKT